MKYAYVNGITNDDFLVGVLLMFVSLKQNSKLYQAHSVDLCCFVTENVSENAKKKLTANGISIFVPQDDLCTGEGRWSTTFTKLCIFCLTKYDKIVWIDADMLVLNSLDDLFQKPHMSCVRSRAKMFSKDFYAFNSGLMVIEPNVEDYRGACAQINSVVENYQKKNMPVGDQNVLNEYFIDWHLSEEKHLEDGYNVFWGSIEQYIDNDFSYIYRRIQFMWFISPVRISHGKKQIIFG